MKYVTPAALVAAAVLCACSDAPQTPVAPSIPLALSSAPADASTDGTWLVRFSGGVPAGFEQRVAALGGTVVFAHGGAGIGAVQGLTPQAAAQLGALRGVQAVTPDESTVLPTLNGELAVAEPLEGELASASDPTAARYYARQWHMAAIGAPAAWAAGRTGSPAVRVAILDTGIDYLHPDLVGRVDLVNSRSFIPSEQALLQANFPGALPFADLHMHGTHVGGTISSNGVMAAGVTSNVTLVAVKVCNVSGRCPVSGVLAGLVYAADLGVDVANLSLGTFFERSDSTGAALNGPALTGVLNSAFNYAHRKGVTVVVAAGNAAADMDHDGNTFRTYCGAATVICVSATGPAAAASPTGPFYDVDTQASYSNYGRSAVSVAAPGGYKAPVWAACSHFSLTAAPCRAGTVFVAGLNGTSMASPHVAGLAALIVEDVGRNPAQVRARLQQTADDLGEAGTDPVYGKGRINVPRALGLN
jgi:subtilisin family serine protease